METGYSAPLLCEQGDDVLVSGDQLVGLDDDGLHFKVEMPKDENHLVVENPKYWDGLELKLPGQGHQSDIDCGQVKAVYRRADGKAFRHAAQNCNRPGCPRCFRLWAAKRAGRVADWILAVSARQRVPLPPRVWHVSWDIGVEFGEKLESMEDLRQHVDAMWSWMLRWHDNSDPLGMVYFFHPYSIICGICRKPTGTHQLPVLCPNCAKPAVYLWTWNPHLHAITNFVIPEAAVQAAESDAIDSHHAIFRNHSWPNPICDRDTLLRTVSYELGHSLFIDPRESGKNAPRSVIYRGSYNAQASDHTETVCKSDTLEKVKDEETGQVVAELDFDEIHFFPEESGYRVACNPKFTGQKLQSSRTIFCIMDREPRARPSRSQIDRVFGWGEKSIGNLYYVSYSKSGEIIRQDTFDEMINGFGMHREKRYLERIRAFKVPTYVIQTKYRPKIHHTECWVSEDEPTQTLLVGNTIRLLR